MYVTGYLIWYIHWLDRDLMLFSLLSHFHFLSELVNHLLRYSHCMRGLGNDLLWAYSYCWLEVCNVHRLRHRTWSWCEYTPFGNGYVRVKNLSYRWAGDASFNTLLLPGQTTQTRRARKHHYGRGSTSYAVMMTFLVDTERVTNTGSVDAGWGLW